MKLETTRWVVTGAGGGIGGELVLALLRRGASVIGVDLKPGGLAEVRQRAGELANNLTTYPLDITDRKAVERRVQALTGEDDAIDGLINCAGIIQPFMRVNDLSYEDIDRVMGVNFYGTLYMTKAFLPHLLGRPEAHLVNVSSMGGFLPVPGQSVYGASKAAVKLMTEGLYAELLDTSVHVSLVFPGATETNITKNSGVDMKTSKEDSGYSMLSPEKAADIIVRGIERNKPQIFTGRDSKLMNTLYRLSPVSATKLIAKQMKSLLTP